MQYGNIMAPTIILLLSIFSPFSGLIEKKIGPQLTLILSSIIVEICFIFYYFQRNLWIFYTISVFIGFGNGISAGVPIKNVCKYYPNQKGKLTSLILFLSGLSSSLYSYIGEKIINPEKKGIINKKTDPFYPEDVADKANNFFIFALIVIPITTFISLITFYKYEPNQISNSDDNNEIILPKNNDKITNTKEIMITFRFWRNMIIVSLMPFWIYFLSTTYRAYSTMIGDENNQKFISYLPTIFSAISSISGLFWGFSFDKLGFQIIIKIMSLISIILSIYCAFFINNFIFYVIGIFICATVSRVGMMSIINPHIMQVFEFRNYLIIGGFARLFNQLSCFIAALTSVLLSLKFKNANDLQLPYRIVAIIGIGLSIIGLILSFFENDQKFEFNNVGYIQKDSLGVNNRENEYEPENNNDNDNQD
jgi:MFS family permease